MSKSQRPMSMIYWLKYMNLANKITLLRIALVPIVIAFLYIEFPHSDIVAAALFLLAASTDTMDGYFARKRNEITKFGKFIDPLADKLLVIATLVALVEIGRVSAWITIVIISREVIITGFRAIAASDGVVIAAGIWGKVKTTVQIIAIVALILDNIPFRWIGFPFDMIAIYIAVVITIFSGIDYIKGNVYLLKEKK